MLDELTASGEVIWTGHAPLPGSDGWVSLHLADRYHVYALDHRGHGDSEWVPDGHYPLSGYVYDLAQFIHQQKLAPVTIIAHSLAPW